VLGVDDDCIEAEVAQDLGEPDVGKRRVDGEGGAALGELPSQPGRPSGDGRIEKGDSRMLAL
jgi:hypothetical protein